MLITPNLNALKPNSPNSGEPFDLTQNAISGLTRTTSSQTKANRPQPQPGPQTTFYNSEADLTIYGGAAGGGKSFGLLLRPLRHINTPGFGSVIFRRTSPQIRNEGGLWDTSETIYTDEAKPRESVLEWEWENGNQIKFAHLEHDKDRLSYQGAQIPHIGFDELTHFSEKQFWYLLSRNRSTCGVKPHVDATLNAVSPDDPEGGWVHSLISWWIGPDGFPIYERSGVLRWFIRVSDTLIWGDSKEELLEQYQGKTPKSITFIPAKLEDNPILERVNPEYRGNLEALPEVERQQLLDSNWLVTPSKGSLFQNVEFTRCRRDEVPELLEIRVIVDPAVTSTDKSDNQGITVDGVTPDNNKIYSFWSWEGIIDPTECIRKATLKALEYGASTIMFETNQGGDLWKSSYNFVWKEFVESPDYPNITASTRQPAYMEVKQSLATGSKLERWNALLAEYQARRIIHVIGTHEVRERALKRVPEYKPYDLADACEIAARHMLKPLVFRRKIIPETTVG